MKQAHDDWFEKVGNTTSHLITEAYQKQEIEFLASALLHQGIQILLKFHDINLAIVHGTALVSALHEVIRLQANGQVPQDE